MFCHKLCLELFHGTQNYLTSHCEHIKKEQQASIEHRIPHCPNFTARNHSDSTSRDSFGQGEHQTTFSTLISARRTAQSQQRRSRSELVILPIHFAALRATVKDLQYTTSLPKVRAFLAMGPCIILSNVPTRPSVSVAVTVLYRTGTIFQSNANELQKKYGDFKQIVAQYKSSV